MGGWGWIVVFETIPVSSLCLEPGSERVKVINTASSTVLSFWYGHAKRALYHVKRVYYHARHYTDVYHHARHCIDVYHHARHYTDVQGEQPDVYHHAR